MPSVQIVENPRRRSKRRRYTRKQIAAGFGGRRSRGYRRRRNPSLATLAANPRRRRRYGRPSMRRHSRRGYRNPGVLGGIGGMFDLNLALSVGSGILAARIVPGLIRKVWAGAPSTGFGATAVRLGGVALLATGVRMVTKSNRLAVGMVAGALANELVELAGQYLLPAIGLSGLMDDQSYVTAGELEEMGISGYLPVPTRLQGYTVTDEALAA